MPQAAKASKSRKENDTAAEATVHPEYITAQSVACKALLLSDAYKIPPVPKAYAVWYSYASGIPKAVSTKINELIDTKGTIDAYDVDQIHLEHLSVTEAERRQQDAFTFHLDKEMDSTLRRVQAHLASSQSYSGSLQRTAAGLSQTSTPSQVVEAVDMLLRENAKMRDETVKLTTSLEQTRAQVRKLRFSLEKSREKEMRDPMTDLANRRFFEIRLPREIAEVERSGAPLCLAMVDLDNFKRINDNFGHLVGDDVLRHFAKILRKNIRGHHLAARYGGEEFVLVFPLTDLKAARKILESVMRELAESNLVLTDGKNPIGKVTFSAGLAQLNSSESAKGLVSRADAKLYEAKQTGRNRILCAA
ncbi:GGDEF domain-containing protein [Oricola sp.]|uniref:GGDEF domain-containing protein n=1 Tax=Oricola sp. TaxID=1979950 RepID=UPI003BADA8BE